jgi:hypothetical protein
LSLFSICCVTIPL